MIINNNTRRKVWMKRNNISKFYYLVGFSNLLGELVFTCNLHLLIRVLLFRVDTYSV